MKHTVEAVAPVRFFGLLVAAALLMSSCASSSQKAPSPRGSSTKGDGDNGGSSAVDGETTKKAIKVKGSRAIAMQALAFDLIPGEKLGSFGAGAGRRVIYWEPGLAFGFDVYQRQGNRALTKAGYDVKGPTKPIFEPDDTGKAEILLGAVYQSLEFDAQIDVMSGVLRSITATADIVWQLYDPITEKVLFGVAHEGVEGEGMSPAEAIFWAFDESLRRLLSDRAFALATEKRETTSTQAALDPVTLPRCPSVSRTSLDESLQSVVIIRVGTSHGSGVVVSPDGHLLTAAHVVAGASRIEIENREGKKFDAAVVRVDRKSDLALLKIDGFLSSCLPIRSTTATTGEAVFAMGAPGSRELAFSVSRGILSGHPVVDDIDWLQTDAAISPGNSGGPLVDEEGRVVGIVTTKIVGTGIEGLGFAVPIWSAEKSLAIQWK